MLHCRPRSWLCLVALSPWMLGCPSVGAEPGSQVPATGAEAAPEREAVEAMPAGIAGELALKFDGEAGAEKSYAPPEQLVFCRWYAEPERGDYVWIRLAENPGEDGDAGPRLDIDVCRVSERTKGRYGPMPAGQHGSHCAAEPGFAVWWHDDPSAFNSGEIRDPERCSLQLDFDAEAMTASGSFECDELGPAAHAPEGEGSEAVPDHERVSVQGRFRCEVERVMPRAAD